MNFLKLILAILLLLVGYVIGSIFPFNILGFVGRSIEGNTVLQVKTLMDNGTPVTRLEIDLDVRSGPPAKGGVSYTDDNGVAVFNVKPGNYVIYFNSNTFPKNLIGLSEIPVVVEEGKMNEKTLYFKAK